MNKERKKIFYRDIECDSMEEVHFLMWCFELQEAGLIKKIERSPLFKLTDGWVHEYEEQLKTKVNKKTQTFLQPSEYTPDFLLTWEVSKKTDNMLWVVGSKEKNNHLMISHWLGTSHQVTYIENKPLFDQNNMTRLFNINKKQVWERYKRYINLIKIPKLFEDTFCPKAYTITPSGKDRKVNFKYILIEEYLKNLEK